MKKRIICRGLFGFPVGITISFMISLMFSIRIGDGNFYPVSQELIDTTGNELNAIILQTVFCSIVGIGFGMASVIWEIDSWSLAKQSGVYFAVACGIMFPISYLANWMEHSIQGILCYIGIFVLIFILVWITQYLLWKNKIRRMNRRVEQSNNTK